MELPNSLGKYDVAGLIAELVSRYEEALIAEYSAKRAWAEARAEAERVEAMELAQAYGSGMIDGKNAEIRKMQTMAFLADNGPVAIAREEEADREHEASLAEIVRKREDVLISLVRAMLYSKSGRGG